MADQPKFPSQFEQQTAGTMRIGDKAVFDVTAMEQDDIEKKGWINPESVPKGIPAGEYLAGMVGEPLLQLERLTDGFKVDMRSARGVTWNSEPKHRLAGWIPVVDYINPAE
jgi:hypothetical protein